VGQAHFAHFYGNASAQRLKLENEQFVVVRKEAAHASSHVCHVYSDKIELL